VSSEPIRWVLGAGRHNKENKEKQRKQEELLGGNFKSQISNFGNLEP